MTLPHYPSLTPGDLTNLPGLGFTVKWTPTFFNQSVKAVSGASIDIGLSPYPLHQFELTYEFLRDYPSNASYVAAFYEWRRAQGFYMQMQGQLGRFVFGFPDDNFVTDQSLGSGGGGKTTFTIVRTFGDVSGGQFATEPIGLLDDTAAAPIVKVAGVTKTAGVDYTITQAPANSAVVFTSAPSTGQNVTITMQYCYYCKFAEDAVTFEKFIGNRWMASSIKILSCRAGA